MKPYGIALLFVTFVIETNATVTYERLLHADQEPGNWLTYSGGYSGQRHSGLRQINRSNVGNLGMAWAFQMRTERKVETTPIVVDDVMYVTQPPSDVFALDTKTGQRFWTYERSIPDGISACCGYNNRGVAILGDRVYLGALDAHLVALDAQTGAVAWDIEVADYEAGYSITGAPLAVKDKIITGIAGGEFGIRGWLDAYDARTSERVWRFYTIPGEGEPGNETWEADSWKTGGAPTWLTGSFDPELNLIYWGTGNPGPDWNGEVREGDNLYSDCVVAVDADTGELAWYFQFTPHDVHDWDAAQIPVLVDGQFGGRSRKLMLWGNRNAFYYVLDRETGEFLHGSEFVHQTWAKELDARGRPIRHPNMEPSAEGTLVYPSVLGATNWYSPSYSPQTGLFYLSVWEAANIYHMQSGSDVEYTPGSAFLGSAPQEVPDDPGWGAFRALHPTTGELAWEYRLHTKPQSGVLTTAGGIAFCGTMEGYFLALDAFTGEELWRINVGGPIIAGPISYLSEGKQQIAVAAGSAIFAFALED